MSLKNAVVARKVSTSSNYAEGERPLTLSFPFLLSTLPNPQPSSYAQAASSSAPMKIGRSNDVA